MNRRLLSLLLALILIFCLGGCKKDKNATQQDASLTSSTASQDQSQTQAQSDAQTSSAAESLSENNLPEYTGKPYVVINGNEPAFSESQKSSAKAFEDYAPLDSLKRCGPALACLGKETMPTEKRESIYSVKPSGWKSYQYDFVDGGSLYNRCHLIGYQLCGDNSDIRNFMTGTRSFNVDGMEPFENQVAEFIKNRNYNVLYRVTPVFEDNNLVASGVLLEAVSLESGIKPKKERELCISVFVYNVQENIEIDYTTGDSKVINSHISKTNHDCDYIVNKKSKKFHKPDCDSVKDMEDRNKTYFTGDREKLIEEGYKPCKRCDP